MNWTHEENSSALFMSGILPRRPPDSRAACAKESQTKLGHAFPSRTNCFLPKNISRIVGLVAFSSKPVAAVFAESGRELLASQITVVSSGSEAAGSVRRRAELAKISHVQCHSTAGL